MVCSSLCIIRESIENSPAITNTNTNITYDDRLNNNYGNKGIHYHQTEKAQSQNQVKSFSGHAIYISLILVIATVLIYRFIETIFTIHIVYHYISIYANSEQ